MPHGAGRRTGRRPTRSAGDRCRRGRPFGGRSANPGRGTCRARSRPAARRHRLGRRARRPTAWSRASGFSFQTCLPASSAAVATSTCAAGIVRLTISSTSSSASALIDRAGTGDPELVGDLPGPLGDQVGDDAHVEIREGEHVGDVLLADLAGADDSDDDRPGRRRQSPRERPAFRRVGVAGGDALEDVAGVLVELQHRRSAARPRRRRSRRPAGRRCRGAAGPPCLRSAGHP